MSSLPERVRGGVRATGGILGYPLDQLHEEVALIAFHFHWSYEEIMYMEHQERHEWVKEINRFTSRDAVVGNTSHVSKHKCIRDSDFVINILSEKTSGSSLFCVDIPIISS